MVNSLAQVALKITTPGVPDFYQGSELWNLTLVDPDNRGLVDWSAHEGVLAGAATRTWRELLRGWRDGAIKLRVTQQLLQFRRDHADLFKEGDYTPLRTTGRFADHVVAFARQLEGGTTVVAVPRLTATLGTPPLGLVWEDTAVEVPESSWRDVLTGATHRASPRLQVSDLFTELPLSVLVTAK
jgi:(1->4)-alpha-D-glucan 1-alpha-D-glucosylmutase